MNTVARFLARHRRIALDSSIFIYQVEEHPRYAKATDAVLTWVSRTGGSAVTSTITMLELLVQPYRLGDLARVDQFYALLSTYPNLNWVAPNLEIADVAAQLRAEHQLKTPDAIQAATAIAGQATGMVTNDAAFARIPAFESLLLDRAASDY